MSAEETGLSLASHCQETPGLLNDWVRAEDEEEQEEKDEEKGSEGHTAKSQHRSSSGESEESEPEPPLPSATRRKVSFADALGLDLVSVKEFDSTVVDTRRECLARGEAREGEEYHLSCFFIVPSSDEELLLRIRQNKLELESLELVPGSTTIRGVVRVLNLAFHKAVYVRTTLDGWQSHFDLLAEYVPGSSDGETDRFTFKLTLVPPFQPEGTRVEFCIRYESCAGTFWASNGGMNYLLFCHQRGGREYGEREREMEENGLKGKRSCLRAIRKLSYAEPKPTSASGDLPEPDSSRSEETKEGKAQREAESRSDEALRECRKALVERRCRRRAARMARIQDYFSQRTEATESDNGGDLERTKKGLKVALPVPQIENVAVGLDINNVFPEHSRKELNETPPILTHHQIPLLSLDWGKKTANSPLTHPPEISCGANTDVCEKHLMEKAPTSSTLDVWEAFLKETDSSERNGNAVDQQHLLCSKESDSLIPLQAEYDVPVQGDQELSERRASITAEENLMPSVNGSPECFIGKEILESSSVKLRPDFKPSNARDEVLGYEHEEKQGIISESQTDGVQCGINMFGVNLTPEGTLTLDEGMLSESAKVSVANQVETVQIIDGTERQSSKAHNEVSLEERSGSPDFSDTTDKEKLETQTVACDVEIIGEISNQSLTDSYAEQKECLVRQQTDEQTDPKQKKEQTREERNNEGQMKTMMSWSKCSEESALELESGMKLPRWRDKSTEMWAIPVSEGVMFNEKELHKWTECLKQVPGSETEKHTTYSESVKEEPTETSERKGKEILSDIEDNNVAKGECEISQTKTESLDRSGSVTGDNPLIDTITDKEIPKAWSTNVITCSHSPNVSISDHNNDPSKPFHCTLASKEDPLPFSSSHLKNIEWGETMRHRVVQDLQGFNGEVESPPPVSRTAGHSECTILTELLAWWNRFCTLGYISRAIVYSLLFVIFITVYMHDLPVCLAIYLLSVCWWCGHGLRKRVATADSVD